MYNLDEVSNRIPPTPQGSTRASSGQVTIIIVTFIILLLLFV